MRLTLKDTSISRVLDVVDNLILWWDWLSKTHRSAEFSTWWIIQYWDETDSQRHIDQQGSRRGCQLNHQGETHELDTSISIGLDDIADTIITMKLASRDTLISWVCDVVADETIRIKLASRDTSISGGIDVITNEIIRMKLTFEDTSISRGLNVMANWNH